MSTVVLDTITGKSTATTITIGSTPVVSASANSMTIRGEGSNQTSIQQGLAKVWADVAASGASLPDSFNCSSIDDDGTGEYGLNIATDMGSTSYSVHTSITFNNSGSNSLRALTAESKATGAVEIDACYSNANGHAIAYDIETDASVVIHGDLA